MINAPVNAMFDKQPNIPSVKAGLSAESPMEDNVNQHWVLFRLVQNKTAATFLVSEQVYALTWNAGLQMCRPFQIHSPVKKHLLSEIRHTFL